MNIHRLYEPFFRLYRIRRLKLFHTLFKPVSDETLLDVGGTPYFWALCRELGLPVPRVTILNLNPAPAELPPDTRWITADARSLPFPDQSGVIISSRLPTAVSPSNPIYLPPLFTGFPVAITNASCRVSRSGIF
jgi:hypothetical protein